jgi:hypothetical protein
MVPSPDHKFASQSQNLAALIPKLYPTSGNSEPRNHTDHAGTYPHEPSAHTIATIRGGRRVVPEIETLDLAVLSPKRRNPSSARRDPGGASGSAEEDAEATDRPGAEQETSPAEGTLPPAAGRRRIQRGCDGAGAWTERGGGERARAREGDAEFFRGNF